jgi:hypothetical protein
LAKNNAEEEREVDLNADTFIKHYD